MADSSDDSLDDRQIAALGALYQTEISANVGELQVTTSIVLGLLAYLAATVVFIDAADQADALSPWLLALLPMGVVFGCTFQMLRAAVVVRRAALARVYERRLAEVVGFAREYDQRKLGSKYYGELDDLGILWEERREGWMFKSVVAVFAYFGLYALSLAYMVVIMIQVWRRDGPSSTSISWSLFYGFVVVVWAVGSIHLFRPVKLAEL